MGFVSKYQLENTYDNDLGYKTEEDSCLIF